MTALTEARVARAIEVPTLLGTQLLFNVGFYAVVPFIAVVLTDDFGLAAVSVGFVLGARTFAQQGMFLAGGALADRFGARPIILAGCAIRIVGFGALAGSLWTASPQFWIFVVGTVLTGVGGALFSPALSTLVAAAERNRSAQHPDSPPRASLFAWLAVTGEIGAVLGPLAGAALFGWGFASVAASGAGFFTLIAILLWRLLPASRSEPARDREETLPGLASVRDRRFVAFAALHAADLLAYNQLYLTVPLALHRADAPVAAIGVVFAWVSVVTLGLQLPVARWCARIGTGPALRSGYSMSALGFLSLAATAPLELTPVARLGIIGFAVTCLTLGHLVVNPTAMAWIPTYTGVESTGSYFGLLSTCGGIAVLIGSLGVGALVDAAAVSPLVSALPWAFVALPLVAAAALVPRLMRG